MSEPICWESRWHPLREEWVIIAAHRDQRPWEGQRVDQGVGELPEYDPDCPLCPGNVRIGGARNEAYDGVFVFDNDHPCVGPDAPIDVEQPPSPYRVEPAVGISRVVCYSPLHNTTLAELDVHQISALLGCWREQFSELGDRPEIDHVLIFENKGEVVGVSNPHPHCQIYATDFVFKTIANEADICERYWRAHGRGLFADIIRAETEDGRRILVDNESALGFMPYFARYAYEVYVAPKRAVDSLAELGPGEVRDFAAALQDVLVRYDNLWQMPFPYVLALHQAPTDGRPHDGFHFHAEFHPPLRQPGLLKYLAGPEIGGGSFLSDTSPEQKAAELQRQPTIHYKKAERGDAV